MPNSGNVAAKVVFAASLGLGVTLLACISLWYYKYKKKDIMPEKWRRVGVLNKIHLFPVKSCAPLEIEKNTEVACDVLGLRIDGFRDRTLMVVDLDNKMVTARVYPKMVLIKTKKLGANVLQLSASGMEDLEIDFSSLKESGKPKVSTAVWTSKVDVMLCGYKYDKWFSRYILGKDSGLHLVYYYHMEPTKPINERMAKEPFITDEDSGTFNDATSYMLLNLSSIECLNGKLNREVDPLQFRGNFELKMDDHAPFAEDNWGWVKIGNEAVFKVVSPCTRCVLPNIQPYTGERDPEGQPLKLLKSFRMWKKYSSPVFGIHLGVRQRGNVKVDDVIYIEDK